MRLAVEVIWAGSEQTDRIMKSFEYARAGIPEYWILSTDPLELTAHRLTEGRYRPAPTPIDVAGLLPHNA